MGKSVESLNVQEVLALAIDLEESDARTYADIADALRASHPATAAAFEKMQGEEATHRRKLTALYREKFGDQLPPLKRGDVEGFAERPPVWLDGKLSMEQVRQQAADMEVQTRRFYQDAAGRVSDLKVRELLHQLAEEEGGHIQTAAGLSEQNAEAYAAEDEQDAEKEKKLFILQVIQPGLAGLMDGSVSTLAPLFAAAFAPHSDNWIAFKVGLAASVGAGISMGFAEALSDDGKLTGRGRPLIRGVVCGLMTTAGGIGHTLPFLIPNFHLAVWLALIVVAVELAAISWIRHQFMHSPWLIAAIQVVIGGIIVLLAGILIGG